MVWALVSTAQGLTEWMAESAELDRRPGGVIRWTHDNGWVVSGEVREVVPMRRLVFSYGWEQGGFDVPVGSSVITIELEAAGGSTEVRVRHDGLTPEKAEQHAAGWEMYIGHLARSAVRTGGTA